MNLTFLLIGGLALGMVVIATGEGDLLRANFGVVLEQVGELQNTGDFWRHNFEIRLQRASRVVVEKELCQGTQSSQVLQDACLRHSTAVNALRERRRYLLEQIQYQDKQFRGLLPEKVKLRKQRHVQSKQKKQGRVARAIEFVSDLAKSWFGFAKFRDVEMLATHLRATRSTLNKAIGHIYQYEEEEHSAQTLQETQIPQQGTGGKSHYPYGSGGKPAMAVCRKAG